MTKNKYVCPTCNFGPSRWQQMLLHWKSSGHPSVSQENAKKTHADGSAACNLPDASADGRPFEIESLHSLTRKVHSMLSATKGAARLGKLAETFGRLYLTIGGDRETGYLTFSTWLRTLPYFLFTLDASSGNAMVSISPLAPPLSQPVSQPQTPAAASNCSSSIPWKPPVGALGSAVPAHQGLVHPYGYMPFVPTNSLYGPSVPMAVSICTQFPSPPSFALPSSNRAAPCHIGARPSFSGSDYSGTSSSSDSSERPESKRKRAKTCDSNSARVGVWSADLQDKAAAMDAIPINSADAKVDVDSAIEDEIGKNDLCELSPQHDIERWLSSLDSGRGALLQYLHHLLDNFTDLHEVSELVLEDVHEDESILHCIDPAFFEEMSVKPLGHKLLFARGIYKLWLEEKRTSRL